MNFLGKKELGVFDQDSKLFLSPTFKEADNLISSQTSVGRWQNIYWQSAVRGFFLSSDRFSHAPGTESYSVSLFKNDNLLITPIQKRWRPSQCEKKGRKKDELKLINCEYMREERTGVRGMD